MKRIPSFINIILAMILLITGCSGSIDGETSVPVQTEIESQLESDAFEGSVISGEETTDEKQTSQTNESNSLDATVLPTDSSFEIHFIDVGQADASLIICDGQAMLIDGGNAEDSSLIYSYLKSHNITHLEYMVCTHAHEDHVGGLSGALNFATVETAYAPVTSYDSKAFGNFVTYLAKQNLSITVPSHGDSFSLGSANCQIVGPVYSSNEPNNTSLVIRIVYGNTSFLFTGDAERDVEQDILDAGYDVSSTVLKVGHHGSDTSSSYVWLREVAPTYAVISVGKNNSYGHPTENVLSRLRDADVITYRTDMQGDIICTSDGNTVSFTVERNSDADTLADAGAGSNQTSTVPSGSNKSDNNGTSVTYICNTNTKKFHYPSCSSVNSMSEKNKKEVTSTREELIQQGYDPCGRCHP